MVIRTRFSPSPTGIIHLGNARAALFSALYARANQGVFILRIEDTDATRSAEQYVELLQKDLHWLGIEWQEGPGMPTDQYGPYWQSQRQAIYAHYYQLLENQQLIYPCFCTDQELAIARKIQLAQGKPPRYAGTCRQLSKEILAQYYASGKKPAWRFIVPLHQDIEFTDLIKGPQCFHSDDIGDFIIRRADQTASFLFCNAIDDALMAVSHVLRGEDHVANTPRQLLLLQALHLPIPQYGHLSLMMGEDGAPLSKRHGSFNVSDLREQGFLAAAVVNYLGRLGHACDAQEVFSVEQLATHFHLETVSRSPARFDYRQLLYWQKMVIQSLGMAALWHWLGETVESQVPESARLLFAETVQTNIYFPQDALMWAKIFFHENVIIAPDGQQTIQTAGEQFFVIAEQAVDKYGVHLDKIVAEMQQILGLTGKKIFMPLRVALTGQTHGPELAQIMALLGLHKLKHRLSAAFKVASST